MRNHIVRPALCAAIVAMLALAEPSYAAAPLDDAYARDLQAWRDRAAASLTRERGWLTIVSRDELQPGANRIGSAPGSDVLLPRGLAPAHLGTVRAGKDKVTLKLAPGVTMRTVASGNAGDEFTERDLVTGSTQVEWVTLGRLSLQFVKRDDGKFVVRAADREAPAAKRFAGRVWYEPKAEFRVPARFVPRGEGETIPIANVRGEISYEKVAGALEFTLDGRPVRLDALDDEGNLFVIFRDATSGKATYGAGRFLYLEKPKNGEWVVDLNRAYNPPCAFSAYTTCPLPPPQNWLKIEVPAGERYVAKKS